MRCVPLLLCSVLLQVNFKQIPKSHLVEEVEAVQAQKHQQPSFESFALQVDCCRFDIPAYT